MATISGVKHRKALQLTKAEVKRINRRRKLSGARLPKG
jgi:hypothetical protein